MAGVVGKALRGFGKALKGTGKKALHGTVRGDGKRITRVPIAKRLTQRRKDTEKLFKIRQDVGVKPTTSTAKAVKDTAAANTKYDKARAASDKKFKSQKRKVIGGAGATIAGVVGANEGAKRKWPKYKKFVESDIKTVDGKLKIVPKKKK